jgi:hypothetical protein
MRVEELAEAVPGVLTADGFDECILGWTNSWSGHARPVRAVYDARKCIEVLMRDGNMSYEEAHEYFSFNTEGAYVGEQTPIFVWTGTEEES